MPKLYRLHEHNFQNNPGDAMEDMAGISGDGWEINTCVIAFPYIHVLWEKDTDAQQPKAEGSSAHVQGLRDDVAAAQKERDEAKAAHEETARELDEAKQAAGELAVQRDQYRHQAAQLQVRLDAAQQPAVPPPVPAVPPAAP